MPEMTPLENLVRDELVRAGKGEEATAVTRCWRAVTLRALSGVLAGREQNHLGALGVTIHAAELYGYTLMNASFAGSDPAVRFARQGIADVIEYLDWCHVFFSHLSVIAADLPDPIASTVSIGAIAKANEAILMDLYGKLCDESDRVEESEEQAVAAGHEDAMGTISISAQTFHGLGSALASVICAWFTPDEKRQFMTAVGAAGAELAELHDLVRQHVNERDEGVNEDESVENSEPTPTAPRK